MKQKNGSGESGQPNAAFAREAGPLQQTAHDEKDHPRGEEMEDDIDEVVGIRVVARDMGIDPVAQHEERAERLNPDPQRSLELREREGERIVVEEKRPVSGGSISPEHGKR